MDRTIHLPQVAWRTICNTVEFVETVGGINKYSLSVSPIDVNEPGAIDFDIEVGYYLKDYVGHTYTIEVIDGSKITVTDDFKCGECPQSGKQAVVYKSVVEGNAPYLAPIYYQHLYKSALDYSRRIELDILWRNDPNPIRVNYTGVSSIELLNWQQDYTNIYGEYPQIKLFEEGFLDDEVTPIEKEVLAVPRRHLVDGKLDKISYDDLGREITGYLIISR